MMATPVPSKVVKPRLSTKKNYRVSGIDNGFSMPCKGLKALGRLLDICAIEGTWVKITVEGK